MAYEVITLNLIPSGEVPVIHAAQFDVNRPLMFALKLGADDFDPSTYSLELQIRKVDNNIVTAAPASTSGNVVTFNTTEQMTACSGTNLGEIQITKGDLDIATLHFYLVVQRDVLAGGVSSASDIYNLTEQIAAIVPEVIGDDYYTKEEVDEKIDEIPTFDPTNYYDKSDVNTLLNDKANTSDLSAVAFSGDYNDLENKPTLPDMTNYYDKAETDALLNDKADKTVVDSILLLPTAKSLSGSIASFGTDLTENLVNCNVDNSATTITRCGKNLANVNAYNNWLIIGSYAIQKNILPNNVRCIMSFSDNDTSVDTSGCYLGFINSDYNGGALSGDDYRWCVAGGNIQANTKNVSNDDPDSYLTGIFIYPNNEDTYNKIFSRWNIQIEQGETSTTYESFNGQTYPVIDKDTITTLNGINNIFADYGDISLKYLCSIGYLINNNGYIG